MTQKSKLASFGLYFHTLRYLKLGQIFWRLRYRFLPKIPPQCYPVTLAEPTGQWLTRLENPRSYLGDGVFRVLNRQINVNEAEDWNNPAIPKLALYNLHYFDGLNCADGDEEALNRLIDQWIEQNPVGVGNGWEPYPLSLRMVNWVKWWLSTKKTPTPQWLESLSYQMSALEHQLEYHILGNHLFANGKAMLFAGCYLDGLQASRCLRKGKEILRRELNEQILKDGGHFELSPMYHGIILEDVLDLLNLARAYPQKMGASLIELLGEKASIMLSWYQKMSHNNGEPSFFNDSANGIAKTWPELEPYARDLGVAYRVDSDPLLNASGYIVRERRGIKWIMDVANVGPDYLPGHAHADTLSLEMSVGQHKLLVNSGTSEYGVSSERQRQRGTKAHNTLCIEDCDSSEVWGGFRVARRAKPKLLSISEREDGLTLEASHSGYRRLDGMPVHTRRLEHRGETLTISDKLSVHRDDARVNYYFHPDIEVTKGQDNRYRFSKGGQLLASCKVLHGDGKLQTSSYHPEFGLSVPNQCLSIGLNTSLCCVEWHFPQQMG